MAEELVTSVAEVTATDDGKVATFRVTSEFRQTGDAKVHSVARTYAQFVTLHTKIVEANKSKLVPALPDSPTYSALTDTDYAEKKRRQFDRFLSRLVNRAEFASSPDLRAFLTATTFVDEKKAAPNPVTSLLSLVSIKTDNGFRHFKPSLEVDTEDETDTEKRRVHVLLTEKEHRIVLDTIANLVRLRAILGRQFAAMFAALNDIDFGKTTSFNGIVRQSVEFATNLSNLHAEQAKEEIFHFGDVFLEKRNTANSFRTLLNNRTDLVASIEAAIKAQQKTAAAVEATKRKFGDVAPETNKSIDEDDKAKDTLKTLKEQYVTFKTEMKSEFDAHNQEKLVDYQMALDHFVRTQINSEEEKLALLEEFHRKLMG